ncbi:alpha beta hydrolase fold protein [Moniliophthora roreri MCA 2997]|uniref:Alpha beta hydrolase fold protein n=1 Tax=Moniliophthora roreri (strain MCA 2997) TaxID=1381753 RepID=V2YDA9_MONRO|nr:alpha beta hydrolase fold protein [Moniliophthora roreri MCA 2997]
MRFIELDVVGGPAKFRYVISTPAENSADAIIPNLPTVLFLHPVFIGQESFISQFGDPSIRKFNLVAIDLRSHGESSGPVPEGYDQEIAAQDIVTFMDTLKLPPCHICALSLGTIVALQIAVTYPDKVLSLFLVSHLGLEEPENVVHGRREIHDAWVSGQKQAAIDRYDLLHAMKGTGELAFNDSRKKIARCFERLCIPQATRNWGPENLDMYRHTTLDFIVKRKIHSQETLSKLRVSVKLIHCRHDVAYPLEYSERFYRVLKDAGVDVSLESIDGSDFGPIEYGDQLNPILHKFIVDQCKTDIPSGPESVTSPWDEDLARVGWKRHDTEDEEEDEDEEEEEEFIHQALPEAAISVHSVATVTLVQD